MDRIGLNQNLRVGVCIEHLTVLIITRYKEAERTKGGRRGRRGEGDKGGKGDKGGGGDKGDKDGQRG